MVIDTDPKTGAKYPRYLIYDAIRIQGRDVMQDSFYMRYERIMVSSFQGEEGWLSQADPHYHGHTDNTNIFLMIVSVIA